MKICFRISRAGARRTLKSMVEDVKGRGDSDYVVFKERKVFEVIESR